MVEFVGTPTYGLALNLERNVASIVILGDDSEIKARDRVNGLGKLMSIKDGSENTTSEEENDEILVERKAPGIIMRARESIYPLASQKLKAKLLLFVIITVLIFVAVLDIETSYIYAKGSGGAKFFSDEVIRAYLNETQIDTNEIVSDMLEPKLEPDSIHAIPQMFFESNIYESKLETLDLRSQDDIVAELERRYRRKPKTFLFCRIMSLL